VALRALQSGVAALEGVLRRGMFFYREERWLPPLYIVAGGTFACISALEELAVVGVLVAVRALGEGDGLLEITVRVALAAVDLSVLAFERIFRL